MEKDKPQGCQRWSDESWLEIDSQRPPNCGRSSEPANNARLVSFVAIRHFLHAFQITHPPTNFPMGDYRIRNICEIIRASSSRKIDADITGS